MPASLTTLPPELLLQTADHLCADDLAHLAPLSRRFHTLFTPLVHVKAAGCRPCLSKLLHHCVTNSLSTPLAHLLSVFPPDYRFKAPTKYPHLLPAEWYAAGPEVFSLLLPRVSKKALRWTIETAIRNEFPEPAAWRELIRAYLTAGGKWCRVLSVVAAWEAWEMTVAGEVVMELRDEGEGGIRWQRDGTGRMLGGALSKAVKQGRREGVRKLVGWGAEVPCTGRVGGILEGMGKGEEWWDAEGWERRKREEEERWRVIDAARGGVGQWGCVMP